MKIGLNLRKELQMQTPEDFLKAGGFVTAAELDRQMLIGLFLEEMEKGLRRAGSSLMMIPTYVYVEGRVPEGSSAAVLDAGGTNFRGAIVSIPPKIAEKRNQPMPGTKGEVDNETFYRAFADEVKRLEGKATTSTLGWCFSYPAEATENLDAKLARWTKNIRASGVVGQLVGEELSKRVNGKRIAIVNDTVATLLAAKATEGDKNYSSYIGFILGTGTNTAYVERDLGGMIVNAESGGFDKLSRSVFDDAADAKTADPGHNRFEKMIAGAYLGSIGLEIYKGAAKAGLFSSKAAQQIGGLGQLETIDFDNFCAGYHKEGRENVLDAIFADANDAKMARRLALPVFERAVVLTAVHLAAFCIKSGEGIDAPIAICADGSTWYKTRSVKFAESVKRELDDMLIRRRNIAYEFTAQVEDAPMVGAAIAAIMKETL